MIMPKMKKPKEGMKRKLVLKEDKNMELKEFSLEKEV